MSPRSLAALFVLLAGTMTADASNLTPPPLPAGTRAERVDPATLAGWRSDDHATVLSVFAKGCQADPPLRSGAQTPAALRRICSEAVATPSSEARAFFESRFVFWRILPEGQRGGFATGYFEPEFPGSLTRSDAFPTPLYGRPPDLVTRMRPDEWPGFDPALAAARMTASGPAVFPDRDEIDRGALQAQGLEILWMRDPVDRFVLQVQGSGRIRLPDGSVTRLVYAGRNGHPYTSLGRLLSRRENIPPEKMTMDALVGRLKADPALAHELIRENRSFVFFARRDDIPAELGPIGGAGLPLTPLRSIAIDRTIWPYGLPVWIDASLPDGQGGLVETRRLMLAQDTGSAILGPARFDIFVGSGPEAGHRAGLFRHQSDFVVLWPREP